MLHQRWTIDFHSSQTRNAGPASSQSSIVAKMPCFVNPSDMLQGATRPDDGVKMTMMTSTTKMKVMMMVMSAVLVDQLSHCGPLKNLLE